MSDLDVAWAAGLLEGEACFDIRPSNALIRDPDNKAVRVIVEMKDKDVIDRLQDIFGGNVTEVKCPSKIKENWAPYYKWQLSKREDIYHCLLMIEDYMSIRRKSRIQEMLNFLEEKLFEDF